MIDPGSSVLPFGPLRVEEIFSFYEIPRFYSMQSTHYPDIHVLALCIEDDDDLPRAAYLYAAMSADRFRMVRSGGLSLIEAFQGAQEGQLWEIEQKFEGDSATASGRLISPSYVPLSDLPAPGAVLNLDTATTEQFVAERDVAERCAALRRSVTAIELGAADHRRSEFPLRWLGQIQLKLQDLLNALGQEIAGKPTAAGQVPYSVQEEMAMSVLPQTLAASYVFLITPDLEQSGSYLESPRIRTALSQFIELVDACRQEEESATRDVVMRHGPRARGRFRELLEATENGNSSFGVFTATPDSGAMTSSSLSRAQIRAARALLADIQMKENEILIERGILVGYDTVTGAFHLIDAASAKPYKGSSSQDVREKWSGLVSVGTGSFFSASILSSRAESDFDVEREVYTLMTLEPHAQGPFAGS